jgi:MFS family permease
MTRSDPPTPRPHVALPLTLTLTLTHQAIGSFFILSVSALAPYLQGELARAELMIGLFPSVAYLVAMGSSPSAHRFFPRFGPLGTSNLAILCGLCGYLMLTLLTPLGFLMGAILMGVAYGPLNPSSSVVLHQVTPARRRNIVLSVKQSGVPLGGAVAGVSLPLIANHVDYRMTTAITAGVVGALLLGFWQQSLRIDAHIDTPPRSARTNGRSAFHTGCVLLASASFCYSFIQLALSTFLGLVAFRLAGFSPVESGLVLTVFHVSGIVGRPGWGLIADRLQHWGSVLPVIGLFTAALTALLVAATVLETASQWLFYGLAGALGLCASGWNGVFFAELARAVPAATLGSVTGRALTITFAGVVVGPSVVGFLLSALAPVIALLSLVGIALLGALLAWAGVVKSRALGARADSCHGDER